MKRLAIITALALACAATVAMAQPKPAPIPLKLTVQVTEPASRAFALAVGGALDNMRLPLKSTDDPLALALHVGSLDVAPAGTAADTVAYHLMLLQTMPDGNGGYLTRYLWSMLGVCSRSLVVKCATEVIEDMRPTLLRAADVLAPAGGKL